MYKYTAAKLKHCVYFVQKLIIVENKDQKKKDKKFPHNDNSNGQRILDFYIHKTKTYILITINSCIHVSFLWMRVGKRRVFRSIPYQTKKKLAIKIKMYLSRTKGGSS